MADVKFSVITAIENQADAIAMALVGGVQQCMFVAVAVPLGSPAGTNPTHCLGSGWMAEEYKALCEADPRFQVKAPVGRNFSAAQMLLTCSPQLQPWAP